MIPPIRRAGMSRAALRVGAILFLLAPACAQSSGPGDPTISRVLFLGNSLTYTNDLPEMVRVLAAEAGHRWDVEAITAPGVGLEDHFRSATVQRELSEGEWDIVVLQQGPSTLASSRAHLRTWTVEFRGPVTRSGGQVALYQVWPDSNWSGANFESDFDRVRDAYALAAADADGLFLPAGQAWRAAWTTQPSLPLYSGDSFHPSPLGSYLAALTIVAGLTGETAVGLPGTVRASDGRVLVQATAGEATLLQRAADTAVRDWADFEPPDQP